MKFNTIFLSLILLLSTLSAIGQDNQSRYLSGKEFYKKGKYQPAMEAFKPLLSSGATNPYEQYAHYFYALSAFKSNKLDDAKYVAKQLVLKYPTWDKIDEAKFLLANILFEQGKFKEALLELDGLGKGYNKDIDALKAEYFESMSSLDSKKWLQQNFPKDKILAQSLARQISLQSNDEKDVMLLNFLIEEYKIDKKSLSTPIAASIKKGEYNVAVLFPFMVSKLAVENVNRSNQFLLDMYQGIRLAADSLAKEGVKINIYAFDTEKDVSKFSQLLHDSEIKKMDLIIGPVYPAHFPEVASFAKKHNIQVVSPFMEDTSISAGNPYVFLFKSSIAHKTAQLAAYNRIHSKPFVKTYNVLLSNGKTKEVAANLNKVIVLYGENEEDSLMAFSYKSAISIINPDISPDSNFQVHAVKKVKRDNISSIKDILSDSVLMAKVNHIVVFSKDQVVAANVISSTEIRGFKIPIFTTSEWLDFNLLTIEQFERRDVHFLYPEYLDYSKKDLILFKDKYLNKTHLYPTTFAYQGFEIMFFYGKLLKSYGTNFSKDLRFSEYMPGTLLGGFNYKSSQSNRFVPIVKFKDGKLTMLNTPN